MRRSTSRFALAAASVTLVLSPGLGAVSADVVPVVSSRNPTTGLTKNQLMDIFMGRRTRFPDGSSAVPIDQSEGSAARDAFYARFADMSPAQLKAFWSKAIFTGRGEPPKTVATSLEAKKALIADPSAIGYVDRSLVDSSLRVVLEP